MKSVFDHGATNVAALLYAVTHIIIISPLYRLETINIEKLLRDQTDFRAVGPYTYSAYLYGRQ